MSGITRQFLGAGWKFPIRPNSQGRLLFSSGEQKVQESIWLILSTAAGERQMLPQFGCGIHDAVFQPNNPATQANITHAVRQALTKYEPRIDVLQVNVDSRAGEPNALIVRVDYRIRSTNTAHNLVYPFYISEGPGG